MDERRIAIALALAAAACGAEAPRGPNVVLITLDTTRADYLSCYGHPGGTTPELDRLAEEGTRFDLAIATAAVTPVSHASILTGRFNRDHGVRVLMAPAGFRLGEDVPTLATELAAAGYDTLAVHSAFPVSPHYGLDRGFDVVESFGVPLLEEGAEEGAAERAGGGPASRRSDESVDIALRELGRLDGPFFLWLHLWDPHDWNQLPPEEFLPDRKAFLAAAGGPDDPAARAAWAVVIYTAEVRYMDAQIGRLFDGLRAAGRYDDTIVAVTADHGQGLEDHDWAMHRVLYQEQIRVPLIVRVPGLRPVPEHAGLVRTVDIAPTLLDFAGLDAPPGMAGQSLRGPMAGEHDERVAFADQLNGYDLSATGMMAKRPQDDFSYCAMAAGWKLIWRPNHPERSELYDLAADPGELANLWSWEHPEGLRLKRLLGEHAPWVTHPYEIEGAQADSRLAQALESLGYVGGDSAAGSGPEWEWVCPEDYDRRQERPGRCPHCSGALALIAVGK